MKPRHWLFGFLALLTLLRLVHIAQAELAADEAYYYLWSQHLDLSYYSKGPGVALAIRLGTAVFGANEFGVRCLSPLLALGTSLILFFFARRIYGESVAIWTVLTMNAIPIFNVGALVMTIDPLSIFFWSAAMFAFWLALEKSPAFSFFWPLTGLLAGCGFLAKYTNAMQLLSIVLVLALTKKFRREFLRAGFWSMLAAFLVCALPVPVWNSRHAWITLTHLRARGNLDTAFALHPDQTLSFIGAQSGVYSPLIFAGMLMALWWARDEAAHKFKPRFLALFALPPLVIYFALALKNAGQPNWTAPAFISLGLLAAAMWHEKAQEQPAKRKFAAWALGIGAVMSFFTMNTDLFWSATSIPRGTFARLPPASATEWKPLKHLLNTLHKLEAAYPYSFDPGARLRGWKTAAMVVDDFRKKFERDTGKPAFLIGNKYQTAAILSFYLPDKRVEGPGHPPVYVPESQDIESEFAFWPRYDEFVDAPQPQKTGDEYYTEEQGVNLFLGRNALYVTDAIDDAPPSAIERGFERVEMVALFDIERHGLPLRTIRIFACSNYQTVAL